MKKVIFLIVMTMLLFACQNSKMEMSEYFNSSRTLSFKVPSYMHMAKEDNSSMRFEGNNKFVNFMWNNSGNNWDVEKFAQHITQNSNGLTLVEKNDTLIAYEIQKGVVTLPALVFSLHNRNGYSILVTTMGLGKTKHQMITNSIK